MATKIQLEAQLAALREELASVKAAAEETALAANRQIEALQQQQAPSPAAPHLDQVLWLQRKPLTETGPGPEGRGNIGHTRQGTLTVRFGAQYASLDKRTGERRFGEWRFYTAYGDMASQVIAFMAGPDRLAKIQAYEEPWASQEGADRRSDWVVRGFTPIPRGASQAAPTAAAAAPARAAAAWNQAPTLQNAF